MTHSAPHTTGSQTNIDYQFEIYVFSAPVTKIYLYFINWWLRFVKFFLCVYARSLFHFLICVYAFLLCLGYGVAVWRCFETNVSISLISYYSPSFEYKCSIFIVVSFAYIGIKYFYLILWLFFPLIVSIHYNHWTVVNKRLNTSLIWCIQKAHTHTLMCLCGCRSEWKDLIIILLAWSFHARMPYMFERIYFWSTDIF